MKTWRDDEYEYTTDGKEVWNVKRNKEREERLRREAEEREKTMRYKENVRLFVFSILAILFTALFLQIVMITR